MLTRFRSTWLAGGGAVLLAIAVSGAVAAASVLTAIAPTTTDPTEVAPVADTTLTFEDTNGNGIDDDCEVAVVADETAATLADTAVDLNGDGTVSSSEAAQSDRTGGLNCNHGGYVSAVANASGDCDATEPADTTDPADETEGTDETDESNETDATLTSVVLVTTQIQAACDETADETAATTKAECLAALETAPAVTDETTATDETTPVVTEETVDVSPNAHGKAVMKVAQDKTAIGGKNCNHGGAVSEAAHDKTALDAAKAARAAERAAAKAARDAAKDARNATHKPKTHGHAHGG